MLKQCLENNSEGLLHVFKLNRFTKAVKLVKLVGTQQVTPITVPPPKMIYITIIKIRYINELELINIA
jgi:hypothetical protein